MIPDSLANGRYVVEGRLGQGGMAVVLRGRDTSLERPVAIKLLAGGAGESELRERFLREGRFAAQLSHPNVVAVYDTGEEDGNSYIVMELVDGPSLAEEIARRGALPASEVSKLGRQACAGLAHAHAKGLVHRDVKPQNLLLAPGGTLKVADFGIARAAGGSATLTEAGTLLGTAAYMAPEVVQGDPATAASDVYSLGAVLWELVAGQPPRRAASLAELAAAGPPRPPSELVPDVPRELEDAIMRALAADPVHRPASAAELAAELGEPESGATESGAPPLSERPTEIASSVYRARPDRRLWLLPAALLIGLVLLAAVVLPDDEPPAPAPVQPVPAGDTPAEHARNLAAWLRENGR